jgi:hypothetical protein
LSTVKLPLAAMPAVIADGIATTLLARGLTLSPDMLRELGRNVAQTLCAIDELAMCEAEEPPIAERLAVGETLRALAKNGYPNAETAEIFARVGEWLAEVAKFEAELAKGSKAA